MRKFIIGFLIGLVFGLSFGNENKAEAITIDANEDINFDLQGYIDSIPYNDDFSFFSYEITEVNGDEINGVAIDNISYDNQGIVLSKQYDNVNLEVGDKIVVVFENGYSDSIVDIIQLP